jgi:protein farnesyltransferase/geranylgeranyltransferase type-1 subunit alpha
LAGVEARMSDKEDNRSDDEANRDEILQPWVPYSQRDQWRDVVPIEQDDGPNPIVAIAYSEKC